MSVKQEAFSSLLRLQDTYNHRNNPDVILWKNDQIRIVRTSERLYISFAGSNDLIDWLSNFRFWTSNPFQKIRDFFMEGNEGRKGFDFGTGSIKASLGLLKSAEDLYENLIKSQLKGEDKCKEIWLDGHSRGGGLSTLCGLFMVRDGWNVVCSQTFGTQRYTTEYVELPFRLNSFIAEGDFIPTLPSDDWVLLGNIYNIGEEVDEYWGVVRDKIQTHLLPNYMKSVNSMD